jgi:hypothetical protein
MAQNRWSRLDRRLVFFVCDAFIRGGRNADWIADQVERRFNETLHRTQVYQVLGEARVRGYFFLTPPRDEFLAERMLDRFVRSRKNGGPHGQGLASGGVTRTGRRSTQGPADDDDDRKTIEVVCQGFEVSLEPVAIAAAEMALKVILAIAARAGSRANGGRTRGDGNDEPEVHVGFGAGATTMLVARHLAELLRKQVKPPRVVLHALSSGFNVTEPATAPVAFFNFFHGIPGVTYRGLFAPAYVVPTDWDTTRGQFGVRESFAEKDSIQVIITALASRVDDHGELNRFMELNPQEGKETRRILDDEEGRVGDVMYRPFSATAPITRHVGIRAVTLFELDDLRSAAQDERKAVILVAGPCGSPGCRRSRSDALLPLLEQPSLDVWSHLVTDDFTAVECLKAR